MGRKIRTREIAMVGVMAAMVYVASMIQIPIPTDIGSTRIHVGNVMCLLGGLLLGPLFGGLAAGIGSAFFDLTNPAFIASAPTTFIFKFLMAYIAGTLYQKWTKGENVVVISSISSAIGSFIYVVLYLIKSFIEAYYFQLQPMEAVIISLSQKGIVSLTNAVIAVIVVVPLSLALRPAVKRMV